MRKGARASFDYDFQDRTFAVSVDPKPGQWRVIIEPRPPVTRATVEMPPAPPLSPAPAPVAPPPPAPAARPAAAPAPAPAAATGSLLPIDQMLVQMHELSCSDLHLSTNAVPQVRLHGEIKPLGDSYGVLEAEEMMRLLTPIIPEKNRREFEDRNDTDFAHSIPGVSSFRANVFRDRHGPGAVFRAIPFNILSPDQLGLPKGVLDLCYLTKGLVVVTGPTGSGKSTTLATLIDYVNRNRHDHIITDHRPFDGVLHRGGRVGAERERR